MLVLSRRVGEAINIGDDIVLTVTEIRGGQVRIGLTAPRDVSILRSELADNDRSFKDAYEKALEGR